jgi:hypothetical protein
MSIAYRTEQQVSAKMNATPDIPRVIVGESLALGVRAQDPSGIRQIWIECFNFSLWNSTRCKTAAGELITPDGLPMRSDLYSVVVPIPLDAATGKWGIRSVRFINGKNHTATYYRGQSRFDDVVFEVLPLPAEQEEVLRFDGIQVINGQSR